MDRALKSWNRPIIQDWIFESWNLEILNYGIQDWIGQIAVTKIEGSYFNVMGFPMDKIYDTLLTF